jgi:GTP-binding protein YchF
VYSPIELHDIAGLVEGAAEGLGLGNQFLNDVRSVDCLLHVVRLFEDKEVIHVDSSVDPARDAAVIESELRLADIATLERHAAKLVKARGKDPTSAEELARVEALVADLESGEDERTGWSIGEELPSIYERLLVSKPMIYLANVDPDGASDEALAEFNASLPPSSVVLPASAALEEEMASMSDEDRAEFLEEGETPLDGRLAAAVADALPDVGQFFTVGPEEARSWKLNLGSTIKSAAGNIHGDLEEHFINAQVWSGVDAYVGGERPRTEGKAYVVRDGDVVLINHRA